MAKKRKYSSLTPRTKKFNGKIYKLTGSWSTKSLANKQAKKLRKRGFNARVYSYYSNSSSFYPVYAVYTRKK